MTPIKDLLWLAETSLHWLWQIMISNSDELRQVNISFVKLDRELKIDWTKSSPGDKTFVSVDRELKNRHWNTDWFLMYISQVKCVEFRICSLYENNIQPIYAEWNFPPLSIETVHFCLKGC